MHFFGILFQLKLTGVQEEMILKVCLFAEASRADLTFKWP